MKNKYLLLFFLLQFILIHNSCYNSRQKASNENISICFTGDIIPHKSIKKSSNLFNNVTNVIKKHDLAFGNLEGPFAASRLKYDHYRAFNSTHEFINQLKNSGFDILNIANNHILDCQYEGLKQTITNLNKYNFHITGLTMDEQPVLTIIETNQIKIGFIGLTVLLNYPNTNKGKTNIFYNPYLNKVHPYIKKASEKVDYLIMSIHWGQEYKTNNLKLKKYADKLFQNGVDCIIGHHPHILLPLEYKKEKGHYKNIVAYSMGNFIANIGKEYDHKIHSPYEEWREIAGNNRRSAILSLNIHRSNDQVYVNKLDVIPVWIHNNYMTYRTEKRKKRKVLPYLLKNCPSRILTSSQKAYERKKIFRSVKYY